MTCFVSSCVRSLSAETTGASNSRPRPGGGLDLHPAGQVIEAFESPIDDLSFPTDPLRDRDAYCEVRMTDGRSEIVSLESRSRRWRTPWIPGIRGWASDPISAQPLRFPSSLPQAWITNRQVHPPRVQGAPHPPPNGRAVFQKFGENTLRGWCPGCQRTVPLVSDLGTAGTGSLVRCGYSNI